MENKTAPLEVKNIQKSFAGRVVLDNVSISLKNGEIFGLVGLNGIGKTTLIKIILDLLKADGGEVALFGQAATHESARQNLSYLPEKFQPSRYLKGKEYLAQALSFYKKEYADDAARTGAEGLDLNPDALPNMVKSYSKGMGQKLGLLGALLVDAPLLLLDEPMSGLDPRARIFLKNRLLEQKELGKTIFFSSHILADIEEICDRIGILHNGKLIFCGTPADFMQTHTAPSLERAFLKAIEVPLVA